MSDAALRRVMLVLGALGAIVAGYLTYVHYAGIRPACSPGGGCEKVQSSSYARLAGAPVALLGLLSYLAVLGLLVARSRDELGRLLVLAIALVGFGFSAYLTYRELFTIDAICQWCVSSAAIMTLLLLGALERFMRPER
ncbi:MAG: vitamin K epoxide reductase family protein [Solirubrobacteraceae bacterium]